MNFGHMVIDAVLEKELKPGKIENIDVPVKLMIKSLNNYRLFYFS